MYRLRQLFPINTNAVILLLASAYSLSLIESSDLLATIFAYSLSGLVLIITILVIVNFFRLKNNLQLTILPKSKDFIQYLDRPCHLKLEVKNLEVLPLCQIKVNINFHLSQFPPLALVLNTKERHFTTDYQIEFPHHGEWKIKNITYQISDIFGLATMSRTIFQNNMRAIHVEPSKQQTPELPLIFSSLTAGDVINLPQRKFGDYYDLKKYHPSDGISKIVWKIFARNQELIARHPEETALPSGKSLIFLCGDATTPILGRHCLNYLEQIKRKDLEFIFACSGKHPPVINDLAEATALLLANVWSAESKNWKTQQTQLNQFLQIEKNCLEIALFIEANNPIRQRMISFCKAKNIKVLLVTSLQTAPKASWISKFLFNLNPIQATLNKDKIISKYV